MADTPEAEPSAAPVAPLQTIAPPGRTGPAGVALVLGAVALYGAYFVIRAQALGSLAAAAAVLPLAAAVAREPAAVHATLLVALLLAWPATGAPMAWPAYLFGPLLAYAVAVGLVPRLRHRVGWLRRGRFDRVTLALVAGTVAISCAALVVWFRWLRPDMSDMVRAMPRLEGLALLGAIAAFSVINAALEEAIWRGVLLESLDAALGPGALAVGVQAVSFGLAHVAGFPRGPLGVAMATVYGVMLGVVRRRSGGILAPLAAHVFADLTIALLLLTLTR